MSGSALPMSNDDRLKGSAPLRVWLIAVGEPLPTDPGPPRMLRVGILASYMHRRGFDVTWWTSAFDHQLKTIRADVPASGRSPEGYRLELLAGQPYASNVSLARIRNHRQTAAQFSGRAPRSARPDVILCSYPTIELCDAAVSYGRLHGVPVVLDIRDLWPDIFLHLVPRALQGFARVALAGMFKASRRACGDATAIVGITERFVDWGVARGGRARAGLDRSFPLAYEARTPTLAELERARRYWDDASVIGDKSNLCFFGTMGRQFDIGTVLNAARVLRDRPVRFVLCGAGDRLEEFRGLSQGLPNVLMPGWIDAAAIRVLMERSAAGLAPYHCEWSFTMSLPNKSIEYLAGGLPVISSLSGELALLLDQEDCGWTYTEGDPSALVGVIEQLLSDPVRRQAMASNARRTYETRFNSEVIYGRLIEYLAEVAADSRSRVGRSSESRAA
jgi:glycosyltransferase involved in cell wall biosynthesis